MHAGNGGGVARKARRTRRSFGKLRKLPSGRYQASYLDPAGERRNAPTTFDAKIDAEAWLAQQHAAITTGAWRGRDDRITVGEYADAWLKTHQVRERTRYHYQVQLDRWIKPTFGTTPMSKVTPVMIRRWLGIFPSDKPAARANAYRVLAQVFRAAVDEGVISESPAKVRGAGQYERKREGRVLTLAEVTALAGKVPEHRRLAIYLAAYCALRPGEVLGLRRRDIDTRAHALNVRETASAVHAGSARVGPVKTRSSVRTVHYPEMLHADVLEQLREHAADGPMGHLFPSPMNPGEPLSYTGFLYMVRTCAERAKIGDVKPHDLRHTGAMLAADTGATTKELMARLGHDSPTVAMKYQHAVKARDRSIADALGAAITAAGKTDDEQETTTDE